MVLTNSGKTKYLVNQLQGRFRGTFDYTVLICPTFVHNKTNEGFVDDDLRIIVSFCLQEKVEIWLKLSSYFFQGTNTLIVLDDCAAAIVLFYTPSAKTMKAVF